MATAYANQYLPGVDTPHNLLVAEQAIEQYHRVLDLGPTGSSEFGSVQGIAYLYLNMKRFDDSKKYYGMASHMEPYDPEPYYSVGVTDWTISYQVRTEARARLRMRSDEYRNHRDPDQKKACDNLRS